MFGCKNLSSVKAIFFDFDGTIVDSLPFLERVYFDIVEQFGFTGTKEEFQRLNGLTASEIAAYLREKYHVSLDENKLKSLFHEFFKKEYKNHVRFFVGVLPFIDWLRKRGFTLAIVTSADRWLVENFLEENGVNAHFDEIFTLPLGAKGKPSPDIYLHALKTLEIESSEVIVFEDSENGQRAARQADIFTIDFTPEIGWVEVHRQFKEEMPEVRVVELSSDFTCVTEDFYLTHEQIERGEKWKNRKEGSSLFYDQSIFALHTFNSRRIRGGWIPYSVFAASKNQDSFDLWVVGVSAITCKKDTFLFAKRSLSILNFPDEWELAPAGAFSETSPSTSLEKEFQEELGISIHLQNERPEFAVIDYASRVVDIVFQVTIDQSPIISAEYQEYRWVSISELSTFYKNEKVLKTSRLLLDFYLSK